MNLGSSYSIRLGGGITKGPTWKPKNSSIRLGGRYEPFKSLSLGEHLFGGRFCGPEWKPYKTPFKIHLLDSGFGGGVTKGPQ